MTKASGSRGTSLLRKKRSPSNSFLCFSRASCSFLLASICSAVSCSEQSIQSKAPAKPLTAGGGSWVLPPSSCQSPCSHTAQSQPALSHETCCRQSQAARAEPPHQALTPSTGNSSISTSSSWAGATTRTRLALRADSFCSRRPRRHKRQAHRGNPPRAGTDCLLWPGQRGNQALLLSPCTMSSPHQEGSMARTPRPHRSLHTGS